MTHWTDDERITEVLREARLMFLAVSGPHVTPLAFDHRGDDLWAITPRRSAKVRAIRRDPRVGVLVRHGEDAVLLGGRAHLVDPLAGRGLSSLLRPDRPLALVGYLTRNERRVLGAVRDHPSPTLPLGRIAVRIQIHRGALIRNHRLRAHWGDWPEATELLTGAPQPQVPDLQALPEHIRGLLAQPNPHATVGWSSPAGPLALPATWDPTGLATVPAGALELAGALTAGPACLCVEASGTRLRSRRGALLVGTGRARADGTVTIEQRRLTWWSGEDARTVTSPPRGTLGALLRNV